MGNQSDGTYICYCFKYKMKDIINFLRYYYNFYFVRSLYSLKGYDLIIRKFDSKQLIFWPISSSFKEKSKTLYKNFEMKDEGYIIPLYSWPNKILEIKNIYPYILIDLDFTYYY